MPLYFPPYPYSNNPDLSPSLFEDWTANGFAGDTGFGQSVSGTGAANAVLAAVAGHPGIIQLQTGTTTTGRSGLLRAINPGFFKPGSDAAVYDVICRVPTLSNATDTFSVYVGWADSVTGEPTNGIYFAYVPTATFTCTGTTVNTNTTVSGLTGFSGVIDITSIQPGMAVTGTGIQANTTVSSVNTGAGTMVISPAANASGTVTLTFTIGNFWVCKSASASAYSAQVTNTAVVANDWFHGRVSLNAAATSASYLIGLNGAAPASVATITTNITTANRMGPIFNIIKSAGTTSRNLDVDRYSHVLTLGSTR